MDMFSFKSVRMSLVAISLIVSSITTCILGGSFLYHIVKEHNDQLVDYREELESLVEMRLVNETQIAMSLLQEIYGRQQQGLLTAEQAQKEAADLVRSLRYDNGEGYFWVDTEEGINVVLLGRESEGKKRIDITDPTGKFFVAEIIENSKQDGGGFTNFMFPKPGETVPMPKRVYAAFFEPWRWVIGTGIWIDNIDRMVAERQAVLDEHLRNELFGAGFILVLLQGLFVFLALYVGEAMSKPILAMTEQLSKLGSGNLEEDAFITEEMRSVMLRKDELGIMGRAMQEMRDRLLTYQSAILDMARNDALTGLANRRYLQEYVDRLGEGNRFILVALDLDHFKEVNDTWGHQTGDAALLILSEMLKSSFHDALNVRTGGDEFLVVLSGMVTLPDVEERLRQFMEQLVAIYQTDPGLEKLTISAGVACSMKDPVPFDVLAQQCDDALYQAKEAGRSCYRVYNESMGHNPEKAGRHNDEKAR